MHQPVCDAFSFGRNLADLINACVNVVPDWSDRSRSKRCPARREFWVNFCIFEAVETRTILRLQRDDIFDIRRMRIADFANFSSPLLEKSPKSS
jgi:hypothetical protein